jgi:hypothetical protein
MRRIASILVFAAMTALPVLDASSQQKSYSLDDLKALDKTGAWDELRGHLTDVRPSQRGQQWNRIAEHACLRLPRDSDDYSIYKPCADVLTAATASEPKNKDFALRVAMFFGQTDWAKSFAVPFFARAITLPHDRACASPELSRSVRAGLMHSATDEDKELVEQAQKLAFELCWPETRGDILVGLDRSARPYLLNICPTLKREHALTPDQDAECDRAVSAR